MSQSSRPPSRHFTTPLSSERIDRGWANIAQSLPTTSNRSFLFGARVHAQRFAPAFAIAAACAVVLLLVLRPPWQSSKGAIDGALLQTGTGEEQTLELADGSRIFLEEVTRLRLVRVSGRDIRLELETGHIDLSVTHVDGRAFTVSARGVDVGVVGTRFHVGIDPDDREVHVSVQEGRVLLTRKDNRVPARFLGAGESWSADPLELVAPAATPAPLPAPSAKPRAVPSKAPSPPKLRLSKEFRKHSKDGRYDLAYAEVGAEFFTKDMTTLSAEELNVLAQAARLSGHPREASLAYDALRSSYPDDARAGLASLELGRLRLGELDDAEGAKEAFEDAIRLAPEGFYRQDAEARRVQALEAIGDHDACVEARDRYLAVYPQGVHALSIGRRCR